MGDLPNPVAARRREQRPRNAAASRRPGPSANCFIVRDANGQELSYVYYESEPGRD